MINMDTIIDIIQEAVTNIEVDKLDRDIPLKDQGLDSLDVVSIIFALEENFNIKIPEEDLTRGKLDSIHDIFNYVNNQN